MPVLKVFLEDLEKKNSEKLKILLSQKTQKFLRKGEKLPETSFERS